MSQEPHDPNAKASENPSPKPPEKKSSTVVRVAVTVGVLGVGLLLLWTLVGEELYEQVQEYRAAVVDLDESAPVGYLGLNYRKEYNARPPRFHFEEDGKKLLWASIGDGETPDYYDVTEAEFDPQVLQGGFGRDSIPGVDYPILEPPDGEVASNIGRKNEVAGVELDEGPRAYPIGAIQKVEVVNDLDGEIPIAVVYARGPDTVRVYRREVDGQPVTLGTSGYATGEKVPMLYDRKTKSLWLPEGDGGALICVNGEHVGIRLAEYMEAERLPWGEWIGRHPDSLVLVGNDRDRPIPAE
ncbi:DUF3179 domain-containing (seleno)protein [Tautonia plasticadhaerens]|uniref:DUF3179 domain-containing protein n=1 Tax=Tautonia plasticadhaerens TaxID=2527974 RepID=A0A518GVC5_9BACT|nr:DUF3179 domain-containing (seleno)protein [Tautonia plasticadhaerens]QDV32531.1 hypothetical protein ElP_03640 [Tautonia plasticadhaerens]